MNVHGHRGSNQHVGAMGAVGSRHSTYRRRASHLNLPVHRHPFAICNWTEDTAYPPCATPKRRGCESFVNGRAMAEKLFADAITSSVLRFEIRAHVIEFARDEALQDPVLAAI
jgi:hypothetical protein